MTVCPCERCDLGNYKSLKAKASDLDSLALYTAQMCYVNMTLPL